MQEQEKSVNNVEVAEPQEEESQVVENEETQEEHEEESGNNSEVAEPKQDEETNARYADMRRKQELDEYKRKADQLEQQTGYLERVAQMSGYSNTEEFIQAVEQAEQQQKVQKEAEKMGVDEETYKNYFQPVNSEVESLKSELEQLKVKEQQRVIESEINDLKSKYDDFDKYQDDVFNMAMNKGYSLEDAYKLASYEDRMSKLSKEKEQEVLAKVTGRDEKQVISSKDKPNNTQFDPANMSFDDIQKISERVRRGERIEF